ncbi:MAG: hypothetical protein EA380_07535 [Phycisphaeraceae bacterium]|nr:MAG: hypothetical protein EA380_07535 [Phycisphaeraceae bacterium]
MSMQPRTVAYFGDIVGKPGRHAFAYAASVLRSQHPDIILITNAENARHGRGLHPEGYREIRDAGADAITLGDHFLDDERIIPLLNNPDEPVVGPMNVPESPQNAKPYFRIPETDPPLYILVVCGRVFMRFQSANPFDAVDSALARITEEADNALVLLEVHAEATSEKMALAWHAADRWPNHIVGVVGTHTHVQTADARIVAGRVAAITDLGLTGGHSGVIGFATAASLRRLRDDQPSGLELAESDLRAQGLLITLDPDSRAATGAEPFSIGVPGIIPDGEEPG